MKINAMVRKINLMLEILTKLMATKFTTHFSKIYFDELILKILILVEDEF